MIHIHRTDSSNPNFQELVRKLDTYLARIDGEENAFYAQYNKIDLLKHAVVILESEIPVACGAIKELDADSMEVKRMYTDVSARGKGYAKSILSELEKWAKELGYKFCVLETGKRQPDAIALYQSSGYQLIPNYGQYQGIENSVCFQKML
ncbi:GNAT family N-acetyltransferase [Algoriphagus halophilus]|uniref:Acetyltransferase (GNAT) family protein n=1 Tax=Algoriphagus halophilus TaxID=226505 RepID=A0A1N6D693_9BACT|nr:GNAT family N-acetyltransferase [Algoriphagus halophilus]SIN66311.1 Acetyltransferase (GNAT) family protein [Algoriphagus halophilus]